MFTQIIGVLLGIFQRSIGQLQCLLGACFGSLGSRCIAHNGVQRGLGLFHRGLCVLISLVSLVLLVLQILHGIFGGEQGILCSFSSLTGFIIKLLGRLGVLLRFLLCGLRIIAVIIGILLGSLIGRGQFIRSFLILIHDSLGILNCLVGILDVIDGAIPILVVLHRGLVILNGLCRLGIGLLQLFNALRQFPHSVACAFQRTLNLCGILNVPGFGDSCLRSIDGITGSVHGINGALILGKGGGLISLKFAHILDFVQTGSAGRLDHDAGTQRRHDPKANGFYNFLAFICIAHVTAPPQALPSFQFRQTNTAVRLC